MGEFETSPEEYFESVKQTLKEQYKLEDEDLSAAENRFYNLTKNGLSMKEAEQKLYEGMEEKVSSITDNEGWVQKVNPDAGDIYNIPEKPDTE